MMNRILKLIIKSVVISTVCNTIIFFVFNTSIKSIEELLELFFYSERILNFSLFFISVFLAEYFMEVDLLNGEKSIFRYFFKLMVFTVFFQVTMMFLFSNEVHYLLNNTSLNGKYFARNVSFTLFISLIFGFITFVIKRHEQSKYRLKFTIEKLSIVWFFSTLIYAGFTLFFITPFYLIFHSSTAVFGLIYAYILFFINKTGQNTIVNKIGVISIVFVLISLTTFFLDDNSVLNWGYLLWFMQVSLPYLLVITLANHFYTLYAMVLAEQRNYKKKGLKSRVKYQQLKKQLSPHFLFNNINVLTSLIEENPNKAVNFSKKLSNIYHHFLEQEKQDVVTLEVELTFVKDYLELLKDRFEEGFSHYISVEPQHLKKNIVTTSLQQIIENVIKHNEVSKENPVRIRIISHDDYLVIFNNLNPKITVNDRRGIGIDNIIERYSYFSEKEVVIKETETNFIIKLPLITF